MLYYLHLKDWQQCKLSIPRWLCHSQLVNATPRTFSETKKKKESTLTKVGGGINPIHKCLRQRRARCCDEWEKKQTLREIKPMCSVKDTSRYSKYLKEKAVPLKVSRPPHCWHFGLGNFVLGVFSSIPRLKPLDASSTLPWIMTTKNVFDIAKCPGGGGQGHPLRSPSPPSPFSPTALNEIDTEIHS